MYNLEFSKGTKTDLTEITKVFKSYWNTAAKVKRTQSQHGALPTISGLGESRVNK